MILACGYTPYWSRVAGLTQKLFRQGRIVERFFKLSQANTTIGIELSAGLTTFMAMAYIAFVNPQMMASAGMDQGAAFVATCIAAALACFLMGLYANWPVGLAPGMGLNAFFT